MSRNSESKFQVHLSSTKAMFQYMTVNYFFGSPKNTCNSLRSEKIIASKINAKTKKQHQQDHEHICGEFRTPIY